MSLPRWDDEMKFELFRLKSELRPENFRVLAPPLGIGHIKQEARVGKALYPSLPSAPLPQSTIGSPSLPAPPPIAATLPLTPVHEATRAPAEPESLGSTYLSYAGGAQSQHTASRPARMVRAIFIHVLDLGFVGLCLALGFVVLGLIIDPTNMSFELDILGQSVPAQVLHKMQGWTVLIGVYMVFTLYWLFFKLVSGATLGESCLHNFSQSPAEMPAAADNVSGERN